jgi:hypothetical protein
VVLVALVVAEQGEPTLVLVAMEQLILVAAEAVAVMIIEVAQVVLGWLFLGI